MKVWKVVLSVLTTLAAIAGIVFVIVKYGDKIITWLKKTLCKLGICICDVDECCECEECDCCDCEDCDCCECEELPTEEVPAEEAPAEESTVQAEEQDFEG